MAIEIKKSRKEILLHFDEVGNLQCRKCLIYKTIDNFFNDKNNKWRGYKGNECKDCMHIRKRKYYRVSVENDLEKQLKWLIHGCKNRITGKTNSRKYEGLLFDLDIDYLLRLYKKQAGKCALSGIEMTYTLGAGRKDINISLDRIDSNKGYTRDNIQLVCSHVNMMKSNLSKDRLLYFCNKITELNNVKDRNKEVA